MKKEKKIIKLTGKRPKLARPLLVDFKKGSIEISITELNRQLKKIGYKIVKN